MPDETRRSENIMILVTGGTGTLGRHVLPLLRRAGHEVRVLSRAHGADLATGAGVAAALDGADTILHLAGSAKGDGDKARTLVRAAKSARHIVYISVVGCERIPVRTAVDRAGFGYFAEKRTAELVIENSGLPWTTLRATQFHDLTLKVAESAAKLPVMPAFAGVRFQPVETAEVAARLVQLTLGDPAGLVPDLAGPRAYAMTDLFRAYLQATGRRRPILPLRGAGGAYRAVRSGANLPLAGADLGTVTWEDFLAAQPSS
jgi:uncharacterized protein YbjT (DUF2867 family)